MNKVLSILLGIIISPMIIFGASAAYTSQTWSEQGIKDIVNKQLEGTDIESVKKTIKIETDNFNQRLEAKLILQQNNFIEIIGLFSAVLALIIINISIVKSADTLLNATSLILALTCSITIFATLIHWFFSQDDLGVKAIPLYLSLAILVGLFILAYIKKDVKFVKK